MENQRQNLIKNFFPFQNCNICRLPFNWQCPIGYMIAIILQWIAFTYLCFSAMLTNMTGFTFFLFVTAITKDIKCILNAIDEKSEIENEPKQIYNQFAEFVDLYGAIKQLSCIYSVQSWTYKRWQSFPEIEISPTFDNFWSIVLEFSSFQN